MVCSCCLCHLLTALQREDHWEKESKIRRDKEESNWQCSTKQEKLSEEPGEESCRQCSTYPGKLPEGPEAGQFSA